MQNMGPPGRGHYWSQVDNLNTLGRGPLGDTTYRISKLVVSEKISKVFILRIYF